MIDLLKENIVPYKGIDTIKLGMTLSDVREYLKKNRIPFNQTMDSNKDCTPPIPWIYISIEDSLSMSFVKDVLFEMSFEGNYLGRLTNGVGVGTDMEVLEGRSGELSGIAFHKCLPFGADFKSQNVQMRELQPGFYAHAAGAESYIPECLAFIEIQFL